MCLRDGQRNDFCMLFKPSSVYPLSSALGQRRSTNESFVKLDLPSVTRRSHARKIVSRYAFSYARNLVLKGNLRIINLTFFHTVSQSCSHTGCTCVFDILGTVGCGLIVLYNDCRSVFFPVRLDCYSNDCSHQPHIV